MDVCANPFSARPGDRPRNLVGRSRVVASVETLSRRLTNSASSPMIAVTGMAGMGVTSTLAELADRLAGQRWGTAMVSASALDDGIALRDLLADGLDATVDTLEKRGHVDRRLPRLREIVGELRGGHGGLALDLLEALRQIGATLQHHQAGVMVMLDDAHRLGADLPLVAAVAGAAAERGSPATILLGGRPGRLPQLEVFELAPLRAEQVDDAVTTTAAELGVDVDPAAVARIVALSRGVPFMVQAFAHHAWNQAEVGPLRATHVDAGAGDARGDMTSIWYSERVEGLTGTQRRYLVALKELGSHQVPVPHVARRVGDVVRLDGTSDGDRILDDLARRGLLCRRDDDTVGFALPAFDRFVDAW